MTSAIAAGHQAPGAGGHNTAEPPWIPFDRDANDALIGGAQRSWSDLGDEPYSHYATCDEVPPESKEHTAPAVRIAPTCGSPPTAPTPAMPIIVSDPQPESVGIHPQDPNHDPFGFGFPYRDLISRFVDGHRDKIPKASERRMPFNALIARPVGSKERLSDPRAMAAMDKEWGALRAQSV